jgi:hypothetical protein
MERVSVQGGAIAVLLPTLSWASVQTTTDVQTEIIHFNSRLWLELHTVTQTNLAGFSNFSDVMGNTMLLVITFLAFNKLRVEICYVHSAT